jgi:predicted nucleic acid-binding protein
MKVVISDTSVLCYLALIGRLPLLEALFAQVLIPEEVLAECLHAGAPPELRAALNPLPSFLRLATVPERLPETVTLDDGESAAISLAWQYRADTFILIDERAGRAIALALGLPVRGLLGIVCEGHRRGLLEFDPVMEQLDQAGFRISTPLLQQARQQLGL